MAHITAQEPLSLSFTLPTKSLKNLEAANTDHRNHLSSSVQPRSQHKEHLKARDKSPLGKAPKGAMSPTIQHSPRKVAPYHRGKRNLVRATQTILGNDSHSRSSHPHRLHRELGVEHKDGPAAKHKKKQQRTTTIAMNTLGHLRQGKNRVLPFHSLTAVRRISDRNCS